jgi:hypothetical protein
VEIQPLTESTPEENIPLEIHKAKKEDIYTILKHRTLTKQTDEIIFNNEVQSCPDVDTNDNH